MAVCYIRNSLKPLNYNTWNSILGNFDTNPTSSSTKTYTFPTDGWCYIFADRGTTGGNSLFVAIDSTTRFSFPAYNAYAVITFMFPVKSGQILKFITDSTTATWTLREVRFIR